MNNKYEYIISSCLCGEKTRYDGKSNLNEKIKQLVDEGRAITICPEISGGLSVPRKPCEIIEDKVFNTDGEDKTDAFVKGASETLSIAKKYKIKKAIFKEKSPSCGSNYIYDGNFSKNIIPGEGITTKLLRENGIEVISDEEYK